MYRRKTAFRRRVRMIVITIILMLIGILVIPVSHFKVAASEKCSRQMAYKTYVVQYGDTLWGLADANMGKSFKNHQDYITDVMRANGLNQAMIYEGQLLIIPYERDTNKTDVTDSTQIAAIHTNQ